MQAELSLGRQASAEAGLAELAALHATLSRRHAQLVEPKAVADGMGLVVARDVRAGEVRQYGHHSQSTGVRPPWSYPGSLQTGHRVSGLVDPIQSGTHLWMSVITVSKQSRSREVVMQLHACKYF